MATIAAARKTATCLDGEARRRRRGDSNVDFVRGVDLCRLLLMT